MNQILILMLTSVLLLACEKLEIDELGMGTDGQRAVNLLTRSATGLEVEYPLTIYAFETVSGNLVTSHTITSEDDSPVLYLSQGNYHLVALAGTEGCTVPEFPTLNDWITLPAENRLSQPLQMGSADINVAQNVTTTLTLYNQVAAVDLTLTDIPANIDQVSVSFSLLYNSMSYAGNLSGNIATTVPLTKQNDGSWTAPRFYTLPGSSERLTLSISCSSSQGSTQTFGYTHPEPLEVNTPYSITGSFENGFAVNGTIVLAGWNGPKNIRFNFGASNSNEQDDLPESLDEYPVNSIPKVGTIWNNHLVAAVLDATTTSAELLLLSTTEWTEITSATHAETPMMANNIRTSYTEDGIEQWTIPTRDEAKLMRTAIGLDRLSSTNAVLTANSFVPLAVGEQTDGNKVRYLCDDATYTYAWDGTTTSKVGTKRTYYLRLVKRIKVVVK